MNLFHRLSSNMLRINAEPGYFTEIFTELKACGIGGIVGGGVTTMGCQTVPVVQCTTGTAVA